MSLIERIEQASGELIVAAITSIAVGGVWVIRRVFTNQKQIETLKQSQDQSVETLRESQKQLVEMLRLEFKQRDTQRQEDRESLHEVKGDVKGMRSEIHQLFMRDK